MLKIPGMLMVGAGGRNAGKTEFACTLIKKFSKKHNITGIKVTTINKPDGDCPRGGAGCGACSSIKGKFCITEEKYKYPGKDTRRMLAAGAARVFWLRALKDHLEEGIRALLEIVGNGALSICESNSLRTVSEPGLFLMIDSTNPSEWKASARDVEGFADDIVIFDGSRFDIDLNTIEPTGNKWVYKMRATAIIIAGGKSRRMGTDKSMLPVNGKPLIEYIIEQLNPHFRQVLISSNDASKYAYPGVKIIPDEVADKGPLMGIASTLRASSSQKNFVIACDIPSINISIIRRMLRESEDYDVVVPRTGGGRYEPLFAVYKKSALPAIDRAIKAGVCRVIEALKDCSVKYIDIDEAGPLKNLNTMDDYFEFTGRIRQAHRGKKENAAV